MSTRDVVLEYLHQLERAGTIVRLTVATTADLDGFVNRTRVWLPDDARELLAASNGISGLGTRVFRIRQVHEPRDIESLYLLYPSWAARKLLPIADDGCGSYYLLASSHVYGQGHPVLFFDHVDGLEQPTFIAASGIWPFFRFLLEQQFGQTYWPFDKDRVIAADPDILNFHGVPLPWECARS